MAAEEGSDRNWATLRPPGGGVTPDNPDDRAALAFQRIDDYVTPTWPGGAHPQQFHLDISVADIGAAEPSVLALGARRHEQQPSGDGGFRVSSTRPDTRSASSAEPLGLLRHGWNSMAACGTMTR